MLVSESFFITVKPITVRSRSWISRVLPLTFQVINAWGTQQTLEALETSYQAAYLSSPRTNFTDTEGKVVGWTQAAGKGAGNVAFVSFRNAGHMVR
jgi:hypothetical protein